MAGARSFNGSNLITIKFVDSTVTIEGKGLHKLYQMALRAKVFHVEESKEKGKHIPCYVEKITVTPRE